MTTGSAAHVNGKSRARVSYLSLSMDEERTEGFRDKTRSWFKVLPNIRSARKVALALLSYSGKH